MQIKNEKESISDLVETGADISGSIAGSVIGAIVSGPVGLIIGGASGPLITRTFKKIAQEIQKRVNSPRELVRMGAVYGFAINKLQQMIDTGKQIRNDDFFVNRANDRAGAEEILEGVILNAQKEYEERKVKYLGNLYASICIHNSVSREQANQLIRFFNSISYRQLCLIQLLYQKK